MARKWWCLAGVVVATGALASSASASSRGGVPGRGGGSTGFTVVASGLESPRGLTFGPDGALYVAEGGTGGTLSTVGLCPQVGEAGPYSGGFTSRISRIDRHGNRTTVVDHVASSMTGPAVGSLVSGVADVKFLDGRLYGIEAGAGCSHGLAGTVNTLFRVNRDGTTTDVANLSAFQMSHPVAAPDCCDFEPDGTWYSMVPAFGAMYAVEPNHGEVDRIGPFGGISRVIDVSASEGHVVPTSISEHDGNLYFGNLGLFPITDGSSKIWRLTPFGHLSVVATGLTTVLGTAWHDGHLYALESMSDSPVPFPAPTQEGAGKVVRINRDGSQTVVVAGLSLPSAMTFGPDGDLYISNHGFVAPTGEIVRADVGDDDRR
jgi:hypothetical protein